MDSGAAVCISEDRAARESQEKIGQPGAVPLPIRVAKDIAAFMRSQMMTGRILLRLTEADLERCVMSFGGAIVLASVSLICWFHTAWV